VQQGKCVTPPEIPSKIEDARKCVDKTRYAYFRLHMLEHIVRQCRAVATLATIAGIMAAVFFPPEERRKKDKHPSAATIGDYVPAHFGTDVHGLQAALNGKVEPADVPIAGAIVYAVLRRLRVLEKNEQRWAMAVGDVLLGCGRYEHAIQHYMLAGALQSHCFTGEPDSVVDWGQEESLRTFVLLDEKNIRRLVHCLLACKKITAALVLCQCFNPPDCTSAIAFIPEDPSLLNTYYFDHLWEIPILEKLMQVSSSAGDQVRVKALQSVLENPVLNEYNPREVRMACETQLKVAFFKTLLIEVGGMNVVQDALIM